MTMKIGEVATRNIHETELQRIIGGLPSPGPGMTVPPEGAQPGILIFSQKLQLIHINTRAFELMGHLEQTEIGPDTPIPLTSVQELRLVLLKTLNQRKEADLWDPFELDGATYDVGRRLLIRGFGIADRKSFEDSRIVIVLEQAGLRKEYAPAPDLPSKIRRIALRDRGVTTAAR